MGKKRTETIDIANMSPDELKELKLVVDEFMDRLGNVENEIDTLKEDRKVLIDEFRDKLDVKTLQACLRILKIQRGIAHKGTFDALMEVLQDPAEA